MKFNIFDTIRHAHTGKLYTIECVPADNVYLYDGRKYYAIVDFNAVDAQYYIIPQSEVEDGTFTFVDRCAYCSKMGVFIIAAITLMLGILIAWVI